MEQILEKLIKYSLNSLVDNVHDAIQSEIDQSTSGQIVSFLLQGGYVRLKQEINSL